MFGSILLAVLLMGADGSIATAADPAVVTPHVRAGEAGAEALLRRGMAASPTLASLVEVLDHSDVYVFLTLDRFADYPTARMQLEGHGVNARYVRIDVNARHIDAERITFLGHELQHAVEIAAAPEVVDSRSLVRLFERIGRRTWQAHFETSAARVVGERVANELRSGWRHIEETQSAGR